MVWTIEGRCATFWGAGEWGSHRAPRHTRWHGPNLSKQPSPGRDAGTTEHNAQAQTRHQTSQHHTPATERDGQLRQRGQHLHHVTLHIIQVWVTRRGRHQGGFGGKAPGRRGIGTNSVHCFLECCQNEPDYLEHVLSEYLCWYRKWCPTVN